MNEGAITALLPAIVMKIFGSRRGPSLYSVMLTSSGVSAVVGALLVNYLYVYLGFTGILHVGLVFNIICFALVCFLDEEPFDYRTLYNYKLEAPDDLDDRG